MKIHPEYRKTRRRVYLVGTFALATGITGLVTPFIPGLVLIAAALSVLSLESRTAQLWLAKIRARFPGVGGYLEHFEGYLVNTFHLTTHSYDFCRLPRKGGGNIAALVEISELKGAGVAVLLHSASGVKETSVMNVLAEAMRAQGHSVVRFDTYNGFGESGGTFTTCSVRETANDLVDVITWVRREPWGGGRLILVGHSLGGLVAAEYAATHSGEVSELVLFSPTVSGGRYRDAFMTIDEEGYREWEKTGIRTTQHPLGGEEEGLAFSFVTELLTHDLIPLSSSLTMPVAIYVGTEDKVTRVEDCIDLERAIGPHASLCKIPGVPHTPNGLHEIQRVRAALFC